MHNSAMYYIFIGIRTASGITGFASKIVMVRTQGVNLNPLYNHVSKTGIRQ